jgi:hypothetical protein
VCGTGLFTFATDDGSIERAPLPRRNWWPAPSFSVVTARKEAGIVHITRMKLRQIERHVASRIDDALAVCSLAADPSLQANRERRVGQIHCRKVDRCKPRGRVNRTGPAVFQSVIIQIMGPPTVAEDATATLTSVVCMPLILRNRLRPASIKTHFPVRQSAIDEPFKTHLLRH